MAWTLLYGKAGPTAEVCPVVFRITQTAPPEVTLKIEGRITVEAVAVLEHECRTQMSGGHCLQLDFADVATVDPQGAAMLRRLRDACVQIVHAPPFIAALLEV